MSDPRASRPRSFREHALVQLTLVRYREFLREPEAVFWVFVFPILLAAGLGIAFRNRPQEVLKVGIVASAPGAPAAQHALAREPAIQTVMLDDSASRRALGTGEIALLVIPGDSGRTTYRYDDTRPESRTARLLADGALQRAAGRNDPVAVTEDKVQERGSRYIDFVIPGLLGMNLMGSGIWGVGFAIVDARKKRLLKRLIATPMSRAQYLTSFILSRLTMLIIEVATLVGFGLLVFKVPMRGSYVQLFGICLLASLAFSALGLLVSSRVRTMEGASGLMNLVMLPMWVFSGVFFAWTRYPVAVQPFIRALPLTAANDALRATMLQGAGVGVVSPELGVLLLWLVVCFIAALKLFRWK
jgi:ABC-2 type transport system permease protein